MGWYDRNRDKYPADWDAIARRVKDEAGWMCRVCGAPHGQPGRTLTVHHMNHEPADVRPENLLACCQSCHLRIQALRPRPKTIAEAVERMQPWVATRDAQTAMELTA